MPVPGPGTPDPNDPNPFPPKGPVDAAKRAIIPNKSDVPAPHDLKGKEGGK